MRGPTVEDKHGSLSFPPAEVNSPHGASLTVDVDIAADVGAAQRVGDLTGDRVCKEGVVHNHLICVSRDLLDHTSSFCPPGEKNRGAESRQRERERERFGHRAKKHEKRGREFTRCRVNSILLCE